MRHADPGQPFVTGVLDTPFLRVPVVSTRLGFSDRLGGWRVRWRFGRNGYKVDPGLYAVGRPDDTSPVLVTANYKLTFDLLRSSIDELPAWIVVLDTAGINVWCAAGKGTFCHEELIGRLLNDQLAQLVSHRKVIVPQLGATGVAAHHVRRLSGFNVVWGPVRAADLPAFLAAGMRATREMRRPTFTLRDRLALTPVELVGTWKPVACFLAAFLALALLAVRPLAPLPVLASALRNAAPVLAAVIGGAVVTPLLLPWLPPRMFAAKGAAVGAAVGAALAFALHARPAGAVSIVLLTAAATSFVAMNFTGSTPFTSLSGVEREMRRWLPLQIGGTALAVVSMLLGMVAR